MMQIILLVGPSGSGKDTLLRSAKKHFGINGNLGFVRRYITRPPDLDEDNYYIDTEGFLTLRDSRFFISSWQAHNNFYGISHHSMTGQNGHTTLLCSISRSAIVDFETRFKKTTTIHITASEDILRHRLQKRDREDRQDIEKRLGRANQMVVAKDLIRFDNSADKEQSVSNFISILSALI